MGIPAQRGNTRDISAGKSVRQSAERQKHLHVGFAARSQAIAGDLLRNGRHLANGCAERSLQQAAIAKAGEFRPIEDLAVEINRATQGKAFGHQQGLVVDLSSRQ